MRIEQRFTNLGQIGVIFLFLGPAIAGYAYWSLWSAIIARNPVEPGIYLFFTVIGAAMSLASFPMMIIGREFNGYVVQKPADNGMWQ